MMGAAGALCCLLAGTAAGSWLRDRRLRRLRTLRARLDVVASLRLMLEQERMGLTELLCQCAHYAPTGPGGEQVSRRLLWVAHALVQEPLLSLGDAYAQACAQIPIPWEKAEEREAMRAPRSSARDLSPCAAGTAWACAAGSWLRGRACAPCAISVPCAFAWQANGAAQRMRSCPICGTSRAVCAAC